MSMMPEHVLEHMPLYERTDVLTDVSVAAEEILPVRDASATKGISTRVDFEERKRRHVAVLRQTLDPPAELNEARFRVTCLEPSCEYVATSGKRIQDAWDDAVAHDREVHQGGAA